MASFFPHKTQLRTKFIIKKSFFSLPIRYKGLRSINIFQSRLYNPLLSKLLNIQHIQTKIKTNFRKNMQIINWKMFVLFNARFFKGTCKYFQRTPIVLLDRSSKTFNKTSKISKLCCFYCNSFILTKMKERSKNDRLWHRSFFQSFLVRFFIFRQGKILA